MAGADRMSAEGTMPQLDPCSRLGGVLRGLPLHHGRGADGELGRQAGAGDPPRADAGPHGADRDRAAGGAADLMRAAPAASPYFFDLLSGTNRNCCRVHRFDRQTDLAV